MGCFAFCCLGACVLCCTYIRYGARILVYQVRGGWGDKHNENNIFSIGFRKAEGGGGGDAYTYNLVTLSHGLGCLPGLGNLVRMGARVGGFRWLSYYVWVFFRRPF